MKKKPEPAVTILFLMMAASLVFLAGEHISNFERAFIGVYIMAYFAYNIRLE